MTTRSAVAAEESVRAALDLASRVDRISHRLHLDPGALIAQLEQLADTVPAGAGDPAASLSIHDEKVLREAGSLGFDLPPVAERASTASAVRTAWLLADALPVSEAAQLLHVTPGRVRQRITARTLLAVNTDGGWRLPAFQFTDAGVLRGLERVLPKLPEGVHPLVVARFLTTPTAELLLDDQPASPAEWLSGGGDIDVVGRLAADLHRIP